MFSNSMHIEQYNFSNISRKKNTTSNIYFQESYSGWLFEIWQGCSGVAIATEYAHRKWF